MDLLRNMVSYLNSAELVLRFQNLCGLLRVSSTNQSENGDFPRISKLSKRESFLTGDKGIDAMFSAVDRDSRFISQDELVQRHIQHIRHSEEEGPSSPPSEKGRHARDVPETPRKETHKGHSPELWDSATMKRNPTSSEYQINSKFLYYLFRFGSSLGYEAFYATFFPIWTWNIDGAVCRYIGQLLKEILKLPRPSPKIVVQMEPMYVSEYGMPSTHAMVGFSVPFSLLYFCAERYQFPFALGLIVCATWCLLICTSRIYLGMHSVLDILGGLVLVTALFVILLPFADAIDNFQLTNRFAPLFMLVLHLLPSLYYPQNTSEEISAGQWGPTWADTVTILAAGFGIFTGSWMNYQMGLISAPTLTLNGPLLPPPYPIKWPSKQELTFCFLRAIVGLATLAMVRIAGKTMAYLAVCTYYGKDPAEVKGKNLVKVELPVKFFTYTALGVAASLLIPALFRGLNIARDTMYTEV